MFDTFFITDRNILNKDQFLAVIHQSFIHPALISMTWIRWTAEVSALLQLASSATMWGFHRQQSSAPPHSLLTLGDCQNVTDPVSPIPQPIFHTPAEGAFCLFIYLLEMNRHHQEPSVRSVSALHALSLVKCKMKVFQRFYFNRIFFLAQKTCRFLKDEEPNTQVFRADSKSLRSSDPFSFRWIRNFRQHVTLHSV